MKPIVAMVVAVALVAPVASAAPPTVPRGWQALHVQDACQLQSWVVSAESALLVTFRWSATVGPPAQLGVQMLLLAAPNMGSSAAGAPARSASITSAALTQPLTLQSLGGAQLATGAAADALRAALGRGEAWTVDWVEANGTTRKYRVDAGDVAIPLAMYEACVAAMPARRGP